MSLEHGVNGEQDHLNKLKGHGIKFEKIYSNYELIKEYLEDFNLGDKCFEKRRGFYVYLSYGYERFILEEKGIFLVDYLKKYEVNEVIKKFINLPEEKFNRIINLVFEFMEFEKENSDIREEDKKYLLDSKNKYGKKIRDVLKSISYKEEEYIENYSAYRKLEGPILKKKDELKKFSKNIKKIMSLLTALYELILLSEKNCLEKLKEEECNKVSEYLMENKDIESSKEKLKEYYDIYIKIWDNKYYSFSKNS